MLNGGGQKRDNRGVFNNFYIKVLSPTRFITPRWENAEKEALAATLYRPFHNLGSTSPVRKLARELADEAIKRARSGSEPAPAASLLEQGIEAVRPQITDAARRLLTDILRKS